MTVMDNFAFVMGLQVAVPLLMAELRIMSDEERALRIRVWAADSADIVSHRGDVLQFRVSRNGQTAAVFNAFARGVAALAHAPGGVTFAGIHWCVEHPGGKEHHDDQVPPPGRPGAVPAGSCAGARPGTGAGRLAGQAGTTP